MAIFSQEFSSSVQGLGRSLVDEAEKNFESNCKDGCKSVFSSSEEWKSVRRQRKVQAAPRVVLGSQQWPIDAT